MNENSRTTGSRFWWSSYNWNCPLVIDMGLNWSLWLDWHQTILMLFAIFLEISLYLPNLAIVSRVCIVNETMKKSILGMSIWRRSQLKLNLFVIYLRACERSRPVIHSGHLKWMAGWMLLTMASQHKRLNGKGNAIKAVLILFYISLEKKMKFLSTHPLLLPISDATLQKNLIFNHHLRQFS